MPTTTRVKVGASGNSTALAGSDPNLADTPVKALFQTFKADLAHYFSYMTDDRIGLQHVVYALFEMSVWAVAIFRFGKWAQRIRFALLRKGLLTVYFLSYKFCEMLTGIRISADSEIGPGLVIHNFGGIIVHGNIGRNCFINQGSQMISRGDGKRSGWPTLGDNVYVGAGAKLVGNIRIGDNVRIGANAVVRRDVPENSMVVPPECTVKALREPVLHG